VSAHDFTFARCEPMCAGTHGNDRSQVTSPETALQPPTRLESEDSEDCVTPVVQSMNWPQPIPLPTPGRLPAFPVSALPEPLSSWVSAEATATQTPVDLPALVALSCVSAILAKHVEVQVRKGWSEPLGLYSVVVLPPANRKSAVVRDATFPIIEFERERQDQLRPQVALARARRRAFEKLVKRAEKEGSADEVAAALERLESVSVPVVPRFLADDITAEKLGCLLREQGGKMAIISAEGGIFDLMAGKYSHEGQANFEIYLKGHSSDDLRVDRIGRDPITVRAPVLTIGLTVQPAVLEKLRGNETFRGRGLLARFLYSIPESLIGRRATRPPPVPTNTAAAYTARLRQLLTLYQRAPGQAEIDARTLHLSAAADDYLDAYAAKLEPRLGPDGDMAAFADWGGKLAGAIARIAALLHCAENAEWAPYVPWEAVERAILIGDYLIEHARAAHQLMGGDPVFAEAARVLAWIRRRALKTFTKRDAFQAAKGRIERADDLDAPLQLLVERDYLAEEDHVRRIGPGRPPSPRFLVNPRTHDAAAKSPQSSESTPESEGDGHINGGDTR
jgi:uncharacterized protein DUF3987